MNFLKDYVFSYHLVKGFYENITIHFILNSLFMILIAIVATLVPYFLRETINIVSQGGNENTLFIALVFVLLYGFFWTLNQALEWLKNIPSTFMLSRCDAAFQYYFFGHIINVKFEILQTIDKGELLSIISRSRSAFGSITYGFFWVILPLFAQVIFSCIVVFNVIGVDFALSLFLSMIFIFLVTFYFSSKTKSAHMDIFSADDSLSSHLYEKVSFILDVKSNNAYEKERGALRVILMTFIDKVVSGNKKIAYLLGLQATFIGVFLMIYSVISVNSIVNGKMIIGDFVLLIGYIIALTSPFIILAMSLSDLKKNHLSLIEGYKIFDYEKDFCSDVVIFNEVDDVVVVNDLSIDFEERTIMERIDFTVRKGQLFIIYGVSGKGKTSLLLSILGLLKRYKGSIRLFGADVGELSVNNIATYVSFVPQSPMIISGTVRDNLTYGSEVEISDDFLMDMIAECGLSYLNGGHDVLGFNVGIQGGKLSGGEKQRIVIARAILRNPKLIILDEPTSALDPISESKILALIKKRVETIVMVSHKKDLKALADVVYELDT